MVGAADHVALGGVDVGLRVLVHPALVAAVLGGMDGRDPRPRRPPGDALGGAGDEPVVGVDEIEVQLVVELGAAPGHVLVHRRPPSAMNALTSRGNGGCCDPMHDHAVALLARRPGARSRA